MSIPTPYTQTVLWFSPIDLIYNRHCYVTIIGKEFNSPNFFPCHCTFGVVALSSLPTNITRFTQQMNSDYLRCNACKKNYLRNAKYTNMRERDRKGKSPYPPTNDTSFRWAWDHKALHFLLCRIFGTQKCALDQFVWM